MADIPKDNFGPEYVIEVYDPKLGIRGFLVIDNTALGPGKGGIRMTPDITAQEVFRLARTMTWKNALAGIPFGGAKAGIRWPPVSAEAKASKGGSDLLKKDFIQSFARAIKPFTPKKYIAGPDVNTGEREMQWFVEAAGNWRTATGKPANYCMEVFGKKGERCGIPHEFGSTGFGVAQATAVAAEFAGLDIRKAKVAIHGFGNVGTFAYKFLTEMGATVIALADKSCTAYAPRGFDQRAINKLISEGRPLTAYRGCRKFRSQDFWRIHSDILIPASVTDVINETNKSKIRTKIIVEAGNIPMSEKIEREFHRKGVLIVPDFVANAGGVISSYAEYRGYNPKRMFEMVKSRIVKTARAVLRESTGQKKNPRDVAMALAVKKVAAKMREKI